jgi:hypothetical protein
MKQFLGIVGYEFRMSIQRKGILIITILFSAFYIYIWLNMGGNFEVKEGIQNPLFAEAGQTIFGMNLFFPVVAGISAADRAVRDFKLGVRELLRATHLKNSTYILGKYFGVTLSFLTIEMIVISLVSITAVLFLQWPAAFILYGLLSVLLISAPGLFFIMAFSLACPLVMPLRVYQILFTGYWYWGNFINPTVMFTISDTVLNASGEFPMTAFLGVLVSVDSPSVSTTKAIANIAVLLLCAALVLAGMTATIGKRERSC